ncbi:hypothetical protein ACIRBX_17210 [Kitasatospora sp. NPDC096147]|uniref:hypothetical protein n=1 Tax=Kitasatospora sp. NPDC096147 TaxID=3364093 RepID=UPI0037FC8779
MRQAGVWLVGGSVLLVAACGGAAERSSQSVPEPPVSVAPSPSPSPSPTPEPSPSPGPGETDVAPLAAQIALAVPAEPERPDCARDLSRDQLPPAYSEGPAVWLSSAANGPVELRLTEPVALCLHGFRADQEVAVTLAVGSRTFRTGVLPRAEAVAEGEEPAEALFGGAGLVVYGEDGAVQGSRPWRLVPPNVPREALAKAGSFQLTAQQGTLTAQHGQGVALPDHPGADAPAAPVGTARHLVVSGYRPGEMVPVGLYRLGDAGDRADLASRVGEVVMPVSRVAVFTLPAGAVPADGGAYCVAVPLGGPGNCPKV